MTALRFERLSVRRMPGIAQGFEIEGLAAGLNVIHGPNASGKTTTARAIEALLWPEPAASRGSWLAAGLRAGDEPWTVELDAGRARYQRDGIDSAALVLPAPEARDRYRLSLHELLAASDENFAQAIARESAGGYDLPAAASALDPRTTARGTKEQAALREARAWLDEARRQQEALFGEEQRLREMERKLAGRAALEERARLLERAAEHAVARAARETAQRELDAFDPRLERVQGDEAERLRELAGKLAARTEEARSAHAAQRLAASDLAACELPPDGLPAELLPAQRAELDALRELQHTIDARAQELAAAVARREQELRAIGGAVDEARLSKLDTLGIASLAEFARTAEKLDAQRAALEARLRDLAPRTTADAAAPAERAALEHGIRLLRQWLRAAPAAPGGERRLRVIGAIAAALLAIVGAGLVLVTPALALTALLGVALLVLILRGGATPDPREVYVADYGRLGLEPPAAWTSEAVEARLELLQTAHAAARFEEERARRHAEVLRDLQALRPKEDEIAARHAEIVRALGVDPHTADGSLVWLVERIARWHDAHAARAAADAALATAREQHAATLRRAVATLAAVAGFAVPAVSDVAALVGVLEALEARQETHRDARARQRQAEEALQRAGREIAELESARDALLARLGLAPERAADTTADAALAAALAMVERWCGAQGEYAGFHAARERLRLAAASCADRASQLAGLPGFEDSLLGEPADALAAELHDVRAQLAELGELHTRATEIRTRIEVAKSAHAVEDALAEHDRCEQALRAARERDTRSALARALVDFVQHSTRDQHLPAVFHHARELFARITHGRYRLDFEEGERAAFRAYDTTTGTGHPLEELSSASRIQLLLAVRLAFVETQEQGVRLPLLLDETLGNSDDERALAIMEALLALAAEGRQLFYFTAQPDEVGKWRGLLERHPGVEHAVIDLAERRRIARQVELPGLRVVGAPERIVPLPGEMSHDEYGHALAVPALDVLAPPDAVHLWYLVDEPATLYSLIATRGVEQWGALRLLVEHGGGALVDASLLARITARARALEAALEFWRVGRGRPLDRTVLTESGAISGAFLDPVDELRRVCAGDAARLLAALDRGEVRGYQARMRERLREYLEEHDYLDERAVLGDHELRARTLGRVAGEIERGALVVGDVDRLLGYLAASLSEPAVVLRVH